MYNFPKISLDLEESLLKLYDSRIENTNTFLYLNEIINLKEFITLGLINHSKDPTTYFFTDQGLEFIKILKNKNRRTSILKTMTLEDYLLAIEYLSTGTQTEGNLEDTIVSMSDLARFLGLSNSSISEYIRIIEKENLIVVIPRKGVKLTHEGSERVHKLIEKRGFLLDFFQTVLKIDADLAEVESHVLEHNLSPIVFDRLKLLVDQLKKSNFKLKLAED